MQQWDRKEDVSRYLKYLEDETCLVGVALPCPSSQVVRVAVVDRRTVVSYQKVA